MARAPLPSRKGIPQSYKTAVAAKLNWMKRMIKGAQGTCAAHSNFYWIRAHPEYKTALTLQQRQMLYEVENMLEYLRVSLKDAEAAIDNYYAAPKTPMPKRERQKAQRRAKSAAKHSENLEVP